MFLTPDVKRKLERRESLALGDSRRLCEAWYMYFSAEKDTLQV